MQALLSNFADSKSRYVKNYTVLKHVLVGSARMNSCGATRSCKVCEAALRNYESREKLCRYAGIHTNKKKDGYLYCLFWTLGTILYLRPRNSTRSRRPTSSAVFSSLVQSIPGSPKQNLHILSISNGTYLFRGPSMY